jgi:hypothetical protein
MNKNNLIVYLLQKREAKFLASLFSSKLLVFAKNFGGGGHGT